MTAPGAAVRIAARPAESSSGELEPERYSRRENAIEALVVCALVQAVLWTGVAGLPNPGAPAWPRAVGLALAVILGLWVIVVAPRVHGDSRQGRGLPQPREFATIRAQSGLASRLGAGALVLAIPLLLVAVGWDSMLIRLGIRLTWPGVYARLITAPWRQAGTMAAAIAIGALMAWSLIRWTNLGRAARALALPYGLLLAGIAAAALIAAAASGGRPRITGAAFLSRLAAYLPWALVQQWLVLSYLNTRIRKAVPGAGRANLPGRAITAVLTGIAFGAMHWPGLPLVAFTLVTGCVSGWLFQRDRSRNLFLFCLAHALAGALLATLTPIRMDVGPRL